LKEALGAFLPRLIAAVEEHVSAPFEENEHAVRATVPVGGCGSAWVR